MNHRLNIDIKTMQNDLTFKKVNTSSCLFVMLLRLSLSVFFQLKVMKGMQSKVQISRNFSEKIYPILVKYIIRTLGILVTVV